MFVGFRRAKNEIKVVFFMHTIQRDDCCVKKSRNSRSIIKRKNKESHKKCVEGTRQEDITSSSEMDIFLIYVRSLAI